METDKRHIAWKVVVNACRFLLAAVFVFSGFVKAVDPLGTFYKLQDYVAAFGWTAWASSGIVLCAAFLLITMEFSVGVYLLLGIRRQAAALFALLILLVMTPLTLYLAVADPVSDCGCFGDAVVLTNWETFGKNVVLLVAAFVVTARWKSMVRFITVKMEWLMVWYTPFFAIALTWYCLICLPILDFRPYKIGVNIREGMEIPEGKEPTQWETRFVMEKNGEQREFTLENYPDSTWTLMSTRTVVAKQGYEPPIKNFYLTDAETGEDLTDSILTRPGYTFLLVSSYIDLADDSNIDLINEIYDYSVAHGYGFWAVTSSGQDAIEQWRDRTGAEYPFCQGEDTVLKTVIRSNPGLLLLKEGTILNKWSDSTLPDEYVLTDALEHLPLGQQKPMGLWHTLGYVLLWFVGPLMLVVCLDVWVVKRREKKESKSQ